MAQIELSKSLKVVPYYHGVKLVRPDHTEEVYCHYPSVGDVMDFPCNVYFLNRESAVLDINSESLFACGYQSKKDAIGTTVFRVLKKENAEIITSVDKRVFRENRMKISEDVMIRRDDAMMQFLTIKAPVYKDDNIVGLLGCSVMLGQQPLADSLALVSKIGILNSKRISTLTNTNQFTPRETDIIRLLARAKTAKEIAAYLYLSRRTVEHYIENIKHKLAVKTKSELIDKIHLIFSI